MMPRAPKIRHPERSLRSEGSLFDLSVLATNKKQTVVPTGVANLLSTLSILVLFSLATFRP